MTTRQTASGINGVIRYVYDGPRSVCHIIKRGEHWKAVASGGYEVGLYKTAPQAAKAVLSHANAARAAH